MSIGVHVDGGETDNRPLGGQEEEVAPPGWYADPYGAPEMRRWDGKRWTLEGKPWPTEVEAESSPVPFNWPALVATLVAAGFGVSWFSGTGLATFWVALSPLLLVLFGVLGAGPKYASGPGPGHFVALVLAVVGACLICLYLLGWLWVAAILSGSP